MAQALANALVPIFIGLLLGFYAGRRELMDNINLRNLIVLVMNFAVPCAMFLIITQSSREALAHQLNTALAIALSFIVLFVSCYVWSRRFWKMNVSDASVLALTIGFPNCAAVALSLLADIYGPEATVSAALSITVGAITVSPVSIALLELASQQEHPRITVKALALGMLHSLRQPVVWSPLAAILWVVLGLHFPTYIVATLKTLGAASNGSALLLTGVVISAQKFHVSSPVIWSTVAKLAVQPLLAIAISLVLALHPNQVRNVALISAIPGGFFGLVFGKSYNSTPESASSGLIASYVFSLVTLPLWIIALSKLV